MNIKQFHIYLADLEPSFGSESGKVRPVVVIQTDLLNSAGHLSTIICPITTQLIDEAEAFPLRIYLNKKLTGIKEDSDILVDQIRAIDNRRFIKKIGKLNSWHKQKLAENLKIVLFE
jgi:mRNA interferase MazF